MLSFLPEKYKNHVIADYVMRLLVCMLLFILIALVFLTTLFVPTWYFAKQRQMAIHAQYTSLELAEKKKGVDPINRINTVHALSKAVGRQENVLSVYALTDHIIDLAGDSIHITGLTIQSSAKGLRTISLHGRANTRADLTVFANILRSDGIFNDISLPPSSLIRQVDNEFSLTFNYRYQ